MTADAFANVNRPFLIIVTGRPGAGKTTFANALGRAACLPVISRDGVKEGFVHTLRGGPMPEDANLIATNVFFDVLETFIHRGVSVIAEAAFQHSLWEARLKPFFDRAEIRLCVCLPGSDDLARQRYIRRGLDDPRRERFHGDPGVDAARRGLAPALTEYAPPRLPVPTYNIDTTGDYRPSLDELIPLLLGGE